MEKNIQNMDFRELKDLMIHNRSYRRFEETKRISREELEELVELTRYTGSGRNLQSLKYKIVTDLAECESIFPHLAWAGYLQDWAGPEVGERPAAYIVQCLDRTLSDHLLCDDGLHLEAIGLGAVAKGLGGCIIKSFNKQAIADLLGLSSDMDIQYIYALGLPKEEVRLVEMRDGDVKYWRDEDKVHYVPKRKLSEILLR